MPRCGWPALQWFSMNLAIYVCSASQNSCGFGAKPVDAPASPFQVSRQPRKMSIYDHVCTIPVNFALPIIILPRAVRSLLLQKQGLLPLFQAHFAGSTSSEILLLDPLSLKAVPCATPAVHALPGVANKKHHHTIGRLLEEGSCLAWCEVLRSNL